MYRIVTPPMIPYPFNPRIRNGEFSGINPINGQEIGQSIQLQGSEES